MPGQIWVCNKLYRLYRDVLVVLAGMFSNLLLLDLSHFFHRLEEKLYVKPSSTMNQTNPNFQIPIKQKTTINDLDSDKNTNLKKIEKYRDGAPSPSSSSLSWFPHSVKDNSTITSLSVYSSFVLLHPHGSPPNFKDFNKLYGL